MSEPAATSATAATEADDALNRRFGATADPDIAELVDEARGMRDQG